MREQSRKLWLLNAFLKEVCSMSQSSVPLVLYRHLLRWARAADGIPARLRPADVYVILPESSVGGARAELAAQIPRPVSESVRNLTRAAFRKSSMLQVLGLQLAVSIQFLVFAVKPLTWSLAGRGCRKGA